MEKSVLIVEDERSAAEVLHDYLRAAGYSSNIITDGLDVVAWVREHSPDLILLDIMLPGKDGITLCGELRTFTKVPIIMTTARIEELDRLLGLELGADDYVCKPYSPREVVARVKAVLRRTEPEGINIQSEIVVDEQGSRVLIKDKDLDLTAVELHLFVTLYSRPGRIYSRNQLMDTIYEDQRVVNDRTIDSHIKKLRMKIAKVKPGVELIHSVYGLGYKFEQ